MSCIFMTVSYDPWTKWYYGTTTPESKTTQKLVLNSWQTREKLFVKLVKIRQKLVKNSWIIR